MIAGIAKIGGAASRHKPRQLRFWAARNFLLPELEPIQAGKQHDRQQTVGNGCDQGMDRVPWLSYSYQGDLNDQVNEAMQEIKRESHEKTGTGILHIHPATQGGGEVSDDGLGNAVHADVVEGKCVLQGTDDGPRKQAGHGTPARNSEKNGYEQRQVKNQEETQPQREKDLDKDGQQRNTDGYRPAKLMDLNFLSRGVSDGHAH